MEQPSFSIRIAIDEKNPSRYEPWIREVESYILRNLSNSQLIVPNIAKAFSLSERQFHRRIKKILGITPNLFLRKIKMESAKQLLEQGQCSTVTEVAQAVGYNQADYFSRLYTQWHGKRPIEYLRASN